MENHYIIGTFVIDGDISKAVQPVYPEGWKEENFQFDFTNPMGELLSDMDDPYALGLFIKKFNVQPGQFKVKDISSECDHNPCPTIWASVDVDVFNQWSDEMKLFWVKDIHPEITVKIDYPGATIHTQAVGAEDYQVPFNELLANFG